MGGLVMIVQRKPGRSMSLLVLAAAALSLPGCQNPGSAPAANGSGNAQSANAAAAPAPSPGSANAAAPEGGSSAAPGASASSPWSPTGYDLIGTEPFWGGAVSSTQIVYTTPDNMAGDRIAVTASYAPAREVYSGRLGEQRFILTLTRGPCSDGMSDNVHAFTAALQIGDETRQGCANPQDR